VAQPGTIARRYAPFVVLAAVQVLLVAMVPSKGPVLEPEASAVFTEGGPGSIGGAAPGSGPVGSSEGSIPGSGDTGADAPAAGGEGGAPGGSQPAGGSASGGAGEAGGAGPAAAAGPAGDRSRCTADGRAQGVTNSAPACVPRTGGDNGGATYQGVTGDEITLLRYRPKSNAQVDAILRTQGLASSPEEEQHAHDAFAAFFEKHYELHGRKIKWVVAQGTCEISPPDIPCFRDEVKRLNAEHKPFAAFWLQSTTQGEFFQQWSQLRVVNVGGWHFNGAFNSSLRPYHYDVFMDGTRTARNLADYWCKKMQSKPASLAGDPTLRATRRKVGIITQDFPVTRANAVDFVRLVTGEMCGSREDASDPIYTPSDISRAQQTANTAIQKLKAEGVTTLVIMSDPIGPRFFTQAATAQRWFPEHLLAGSGLIDYDPLGRLYDPAQWVNAFGPGHLGDPIPFDESDAAKAAADVGVTGVYSGANLLYAYMHLLVGGIQAAGPQLTPASFERGLLTSEPYGGWERSKNPAVPMVRWGPDDYTAVEDSRHTYWSPDATSKIDGKPGAYIALEGGRRWEIGTWPAGDPKQ
jgi:hypothetical protein